MSGEITLEELGMDYPELQQVFDQLSGQDITGIEELSPEEKAAYIEELKTLTPEEIRYELEQSGIDMNILNQIDDETLMKVYLETLNLY